MQATIKDRDGANVVVPVLPSLYEDAFKANLTVPQYLNRAYPTDASAFGTAFEQICAASGLVLHADKAYGLRAPNLASVLDGSAMINAGVITREGVPASRILFPAVFLEVMENKLATERTSQPAIFETMIAIDNTIAGERFDQPKLDFTNVESARSQGIAQLAAPISMLRITASEVSRKIPTFSLGLEISDQAAKVVNIDLTALGLARQVEVERDVRVEGYLSALNAGDVDVGITALVPVTSSTYNGAATTGVLTQKAWIKFLANKRRTRKLTHVYCDIDTALKIENRSGRPNINTVEVLTAFSASGIPLNLGIGDVKIFIVEVGVVPSNTIVGLDAKYAIRRVRNSEAEYQAAEQFVLKRSTAMRFDFGEIVYPLFPEAFDVMLID